MSPCGLCYVILLWFTSSNLSYGQSSIVNNPMLVEPNDIQFDLYTRKNPINSFRFTIEQTSNISVFFDPNRSTKIIVPGWKSHPKSDVNILLKNSFLIQYNTNIIVVIWEEMAQQNYLAARNCVPIVGRTVAELIERLFENFQVQPSNIHILGHSLGAHAAGIAGLETKTGQVARITGLDPAGPLFSLIEKDRLRKESAVFVDVIHTTCYTAGFCDPLGHADFYPNGGYPFQPGVGFDLFFLRSHRRSYWLYAESILEKGAFLAKSCFNWTLFKLGRCSGENVTEMGEHLSPRARGRFFLRTNGRTPFGLGKL